VADFFVLKKNQLSLAFPSQIPTLKAILLYPTETKMPKPTDLLAQIQESIKKADLKASFSKKGEILELRDGVATVVGLDNAMFSEIVEFENHTKGLILDLSADKVGVLILGDAETLKQGDTVQTLGVVLSIPVGEEYLGRVVDGLGNPID
jgi:F-type H+-transporting ATPase subunit alpha